MDVELAAQFHALFRGREDAFGKLIVTGEIDGKGKQKAKGRPVYETLTDYHWLQHLRGKEPIGVVPVDPKTGRCIWGCIDIDEYQGLQVQTILRDIERLKYPLVCCYSKSGGLHLFLFLKKPALPADIRKCLSTMAANLRYGGREIFPKQDIPSKLGSWLNMPYFADTRIGVSISGELTPEDFIELAYSQQVANIPKFTEIDNSRFPGGPPCLEALVKNGGCKEGEKNNTLFNLIVYYRQFDPDWQGTVRSINNKPDLTILPSSHADTDALIKRNEEMAYNYLCHQPPIQDLCNLPLCITRKYGVTKGKCIPVRKVVSSDGNKTTTYVWVAHEGIEYRITVENAEDLFNFERFRVLCYNQIGEYPVIIKTQKGNSINTEWIVKLESLPTAKVDPPETSIEAALIAFQRYCLDKKTYEREAMFLSPKMVYFDRKRERVWFRPRDVYTGMKITLSELYTLITQQQGKVSDQLFFKNGINRKFAWVPITIVMDSLPEVTVTPDIEDEPI